ncbi:MAG: glycosyltransferase [Actinomycetota bacterium]|nr:glycosyltransferase [Actinomycetota bacterium]
MIEEAAADLIAELTGARLVGSTLVSESGSTVMLLRPGGVRLCRLLAEGASGPFTMAESRLMARLARRGMLRLAAPSGARAPSVSAVVPALDASGVAECLASLVRIPEVSEIVLTSDGSHEAGRLAELAAAHGARFLALERNRGPGAARNAGAALAGGEVLLFLDSDATALPGLAELLRLFVSAKLSVAAPRVVSRSQDGGSLLAGVIAGYETLRSPLDMGPSPGEAGDLPRYLPAACLAVRAADFREVGGFDESLRYGEDVDLLWRLRNRGAIAYYSGDEGAAHMARPTLSAFLGQRFSYGTSAAPLVRRHPGVLTHLSMDEVTPALAILPWAGVGLRLASLAEARLRLRSSARRVGLGSRDHHGASKAVVAELAGELSMLTRTLGLPALGLAVVSTRLRRKVVTLLGLLAALRALQAAQQGAAAPLSLASGALSVADDLAYSAGLARGCLAERSLAAYSPQLRKGPLLSRMTRPASKASARRV